MPFFAFCVDGNTWGKLGTRCTSYSTRLSFLSILEILGTASGPFPAYYKIGKLVRPLANAKRRSRMETERVVPACMIPGWLGVGSPSGFIRWLLYLWKKKDASVFDLLFTMFFMHTLAFLFLHFRRSHALRFRAMESYIPADDELPSLRM
jgi:hypothetical protein